MRMHDDEVEVDEGLVRELLADQLPDLAELRLTVVEPWGTDNGIWRLGDDLVVRLPRIAWAVAQVTRDATWLPRLAPHLPVTVPEPVAVGRPAAGYPFHWAIHRWIDGVGAGPTTIEDPVGFARDLAGVVDALHRISPDGAPPARNRARRLREYDEATRAAIASAAHLVDADAAARVWEEALAAEPHAGPPVWVHGDLEFNCLVEGGRLCGLVDWGSACVGDPAVDVQAVWSPLFTDESPRCSSTPWQSTRRRWPAVVALPSTRRARRCPTTSTPTRSSSSARGRSWPPSACRRSWSTEPPAPPAPDLLLAALSPACATRSSLTASTSCCDQHSHIMHTAAGPAVWRWGAGET